MSAHVFDSGLKRLQWISCGMNIIYDVLLAKRGRLKSQHPSDSFCEPSKITFKNSFLGFSLQFWWKPAYLVSMFVWKGFLFVFFLKLKLLECYFIKYVSTTKHSMTNHNHSNQWEKFVWFVRIFFLWFYFPIFLEWNNVMLFNFRCTRVIAAGLYTAKISLIKSKDWWWWWWWWWWWCSFVADYFTRRSRDKKTTREISFCFIKFFLTFRSVYTACVTISQVFGPAYHSLTLKLISFWSSLVCLCNKE